MVKTKAVTPTADLVAEQVQPGDKIKAEQFNKLVNDLNAINTEVASATANLIELTGKVTELTTTAIDLSARVTALETPVE